MGLYENEKEWIETLNEAYLLIKDHNRFREFFVECIINGKPNIEAIWEEFKDKLSEDIVKGTQN